MIKQITVPKLCSVIAEKHEGKGAVRKMKGRNGLLCYGRRVCIEMRHKSSLFTLACLCRQGCKGENRIKLGKKSRGLFSFLSLSLFFLFFFLKFCSLQRLDKIVEMKE